MVDSQTHQVWQAMATAHLSGFTLQLCSQSCAVGWNGGDFMEGLAVLIGYVLVGIIGYKTYKYIQVRHNKINLIRFSQELDDLQLQRERAMTLHQLLTDVEICDKRDHIFKVVELSWKNELTGEVLSYDVYIHDHKSATATAMKNLAQVELDNLAPELKTSVDRLKIRSALLPAKAKDTVDHIEYVDKKFMI